MSRTRFESLVTGVTLMSIEADRKSLEQLVVQLLTHRAPDEGIAPMEVAQAASPEGWRLLMPAVRAAACRLAADQTIVILQDGRVLTPESTWRGPVQLRRGPRWSASDQHPESSPQ